VSDNNAMEEGNLNVPKVTTPASIWFALGLSAAAVVSVWIGFLHGRAAPQGFQGVATLVISVGYGAVMAIAALICAFSGARRKPRSVPTKIALAGSVVSCLAILALAVRVVIALIRSDAV
jgi:apolipoprotein N-acyltransferase